MPIKRFLIAIAKNPDGTYEKLVYPSEDTAEGENVDVKRNQNLTWTVINMTNATVYAKVDHFLYANGNDPAEVPIKFSPPGKNWQKILTRTNGNPTFKKIHGKMKESLGGTQIPDNTEFKYNVYAGPTEEDMSIIMDPKLRVDGDENIVPPRGTRRRTRAKK